MVELPNGTRSPLDVTPGVPLAEQGFTVMSAYSHLAVDVPSLSLGGARDLPTSRMAELSTPSKKLGSSLDALSPRRVETEPVAMPATLVVNPKPPPLKVQSPSIYSKKGEDITTGLDVELEKNLVWEKKVYKKKERIMRNSNELDV